MDVSSAETCMFFWELKVSECASWVQAWGSLGAIAATGAALVWTLRRQRLDQAEREQRARVAALHNAKTLAAVVSAVADELAALDPAQTDMWRLRLAALSAAEHAATRIDLPRLSLEAAGAVIGLLSIAAQIREVSTWPTSQYGQLKHRSVSEIAEQLRRLAEAHALTLSSASVSVIRGPAGG